MTISTSLYSFLEDNYAVQPLTLEEDRPNMALQFAPPPPHSFVEPIITGDQSTSSSPFVLISAPAAMGKSITSLAIASVLRCPLFNLAEVTVGADTHIGTLSSTLKMSSFGELMAKWTTGEIPLVIDSLDEAPLRSGERAYLAFLDSIIETARRFEKTAGQIIMLGRPQTIDFFSGYCESSGVKAPVWSLEALSLTSALDLIDIHLTQELGPSAAHRLHKEPARRFWEDYLLRLGGLIDGGSTRISSNEWARVSDFLGYPPVVAALAPILERTNYSIGSYSERDRLDAHNRTEVLVKIIEKLTSRESEKVRQPLREAFGDRIDRSNLAALYGHEEQMQRVLAKLGFKQDLSLPASLPGELRSEYESSIDSFVADHPFLNGADASRPRNVVFSDYIRALLDCQESFIPVRPTSNARPERGFLPIGPFYARFVHHFSTKDGIAQLTSEDLVGDLVRSWQATTGELGSVSSLFQHQGEETPSLELVRWPSAENGFYEHLSFRIPEPSGVLILSSPISSMRVSTDHAVSLIPVSGNLAIGPNVSINASLIEATSVQEIMFFGSSKEEQEMVEVALITSQLDILGDFKIKHVPASTTVIVASKNADQRFDYMRPRFGSYANVDPRAVIQSILNLRRVFNSFRGLVNMHADRFNRYVVGRNADMKKLADALLRIGIIESTSDTVALNLPRLADFGFSYGSIQSADWQEKCFDILGYCIKNDPEFKGHLLRKA